MDELLLAEDVSWLESLTSELERPIGVISFFVTSPLDEVLLRFLARPSIMRNRGVEAFFLLSCQTFPVCHDQLSVHILSSVSLGPPGTYIVSQEAILVSLDIVLLACLHPDRLHSILALI